MSTRLYLSTTSAGSGFTPSGDAAWEDVSLLTRLLCGTSKIGSAMATVSFSDANSANKDILFRQYISPPLVPGVLLTFLGGDEATPIFASCRVVESGSSNNMFLTIGIRIIASNGTTVRKTLLSVTRDDLEADASALQSRAFGDSGTTVVATGNYTTQTGDRLVIEIGMGGDPV